MLSSSPYPKNLGEAGALYVSKDFIPSGYAVRPLGHQQYFVGRKHQKVPTLKTGVKHCEVQLFMNPAVYSLNYIIAFPQHLPRQHYVK